MGEQLSSHPAMMVAAGGTAPFLYLWRFLTPGFYLPPTLAYLPAFRRWLGTLTLQAESLIFKP